MYTYKFVEIKHSMWTGKPSESIEGLIQQYADQGWRFVQVVQDHGAMWYKGRIQTKVIFEKLATEMTTGYRRRSDAQSGTYNEEELI